MEKTPVFKKVGYSVLGLRKANFKTKIIHFENSHNAKNCKILFHSVAKFQKIEGGPFGDFGKFSKTKNENFQQSDSAEIVRTFDFGILVKNYQ